MDTRHELLSYLQAWRARQPPYWWHGQTADRLAATYASDIRFHLIQAADLLQEPDVAAVREVVASLLPPPGSWEFQLIVDAVLTAGSRRRQVRLQALGGAAVALAGLAWWRYGRAA